MVFREWFKSLFSSRHGDYLDNHVIPNDTLADTTAKVAQAASLDLSNLDDSKAFQAVLSDIDAEDDVIIAIMGATGVGKTTFISAITGKINGISHNLSAGTSGVNCVKIPIPGTTSHLVLVDTPGFDDPERTNAEILTVIADWLKKSYNEKKTLNGIIYLHRITDIRFDSGADTTLTLFRHLTGGEIFDKICLTTTRWNDVPPGQKPAYEEKERLLKKDHWSVFLTRKSITSRFDSSTPESAKTTAITTLRSLVEYTNRKVVTQLQKELVDKKKPVFKTTAGKYAFTFEEKMTAQLFQLNNILVT